ncbi:hypothetical protein PVAP13_9NG102400, partial [Panicum virgatum]
GRGPAGPAHQVRRRVRRLGRAGRPARGAPRRRAAAVGGGGRAGPDAEGRVQSAAAHNRRAGHVGKGQITGPAADAGAELYGRRVVAESVGGQVVSRFVAPAPVALANPSGALDQDAVTIGRALESVAAATAGLKPVDQSDAAAVQVAEMCATGAGGTIPGGVAAAADHNARAARDEDKVRLRDVLSDAREKLPADKGATAEDAERVVSAEIRNKPDMATTPSGIAEAVTAAARLNQERP